MDEGERKEEPSLPPDYVSLAQLQERWLQKQEEKRLKQKREEEEKREREAWEAQNVKNQNQNQNQNQRGMKNDWRARVSGFVREKAVIQEKGKGKEIISGGPGIGGENDKKREINGRGNKGNFKRAAAVEPKEKAGVDAKELSGGDTVRAGFSSGGVGGGVNLVEEKGNASGKVLPRNGVKEEIADAKKIDIGGGLRGNGKNRGLGRVDELKQSEITLNLEKKMEGENGYGKKKKGKGKGRGGGGRDDVEEKVNIYVEVSLSNGVKKDVADVKRPDLRGGLRGNGRNQGSGGVNELKQSDMALNLEKKMEGEKGYVKEWRGTGRNGGYPERLNRLQEHKPIGLESNKVDPMLEKKAGDKVSEVCREISSLSVEDRNGVRGRRSNGSNKAEEYRVKGEGSSGDKVVLEMEGEKGRGGIWRWEVKERGGRGYRDYPKGFNGALEHRHVVLEGNKVDTKLEKKVEYEVSEVRSEISSLSVGDRNGFWGQSNSKSNKAEEDRVEGEGSNGDKVVLEIKKKMEGENGYRGRGRGGLRNGNYLKSLNRLQEHKPVVLESSKMDSELGKKAGDDVSEVSFEISSLSVGNRNEIGGRSSIGSNKAENDRAEGEGSNGDKVLLEFEKKMDGEKGFGVRGRGRVRGTVRVRVGGIGGWRVRNGVFTERFNRFQEHGSVILDSNKVDPELEKNAGDEVSEVTSEISSLSVGDRNGIQEQSSNGSNKAEEDIVEAECSKGDKVAQEIEKKVDCEVLVTESARKGENGGTGKGNQIYINQRGDIGLGRRDTRPKISNSHWGGYFGQGRGHARPERSNSHWRGERGHARPERSNSHWRGERRHTRPEIFDRDTKHKVTGKVWVKKEEKLEA